MMQENQAASMQSHGETKSQIVIIGAGFGGLACALRLANSGGNVTLVDKRNHHLFQPLLYQVATAALSPADIAEPIRKIMRRARNVTVLMDEVNGIDAATKSVVCAKSGPVPYDKVVIATGSEYSYFGHEEWAAVAPGLKTIENARSIRGDLLRCFELAELSEDPPAREALLTCVIIGGGPTGVELAGAVAELGRWTLKNEFRRIDPTTVRVLLVEGGDRILSQFPRLLSDYAARELERLGVTVLTKAPVTDIRRDAVTINGQLVAAGTIVWAAGVRASAAAGWLGVKSDRLGRIAVDDHLRVLGARDVYAIGDIASLEQDGSPLPALAQVAKQEGEYLGSVFRSGKPAQESPPFRFRNRGNTAVIGRHAAVFDFGSWQMKGRLAWLLWAFIHVYLLVSFEKRILVSAQWIWRYVTRARGARLIP